MPGMSKYGSPHGNSVRHMRSVCLLSALSYVVTGIKSRQFCAKSQDVFKIVTRHSQSRRFRRISKRVKGGLRLKYETTFKCGVGSLDPKVRT